MTTSSASPSPNLHHATDLAAVLANANTTLRNAGLLSALLQGSQQLPAMFIEAEDQRPVLDMNVGLSDEDQHVLGSPGSQIPIIDMSVLSSSSEPVEARRKLVASIAEACEKYGFFQVVNHGVDPRLIERCEAEAHKMFELPLDVKERVHRPPGTSFGYGANTWVNQTVMHWAESFHMQLHPVSNIRDFSGKLFAEGDPTKFRFLIVSIPPSPPSNQNNKHPLFPLRAVNPSRSRNRAATCEQCGVSAFVVYSFLSLSVVVVVVTLLDAIMLGASLSNCSASWNSGYISEFRSGGTGGDVVGCKFCTILDILEFEQLLGIWEFIVHF